MRFTLLFFAFIYALGLSAEQAIEPVIEEVPTMLSSYTDYQMTYINYPEPNLMTAGQPSLDDFEKLAKRGLKVVINLRTKGEFKNFDEKAMVEKLGMKYIVIEIAGSKGITSENAKRLDEVLDLKNATLLHCASSNRVGGLLAFRAFSIGKKSVADSLLIGKSAGMRSTEKRVKSLFGSSTAL